jgi:hypothetical protein
VPILVVSSAGGRVVVVLVDVLVVEVVVVEVVVVVDVPIDSWGASVIGGVTDSEPEQPATIVAPHTANRRPTCTFRTLFTPARLRFHA